MKTILLCTFFVGTLLHTTNPCLYIPSAFLLKDFQAKLEELNTEISGIKAILFNCAGTNKHIYRLLWEEVCNEKHKDFLKTQEVFANKKAQMIYAKKEDILVMANKLLRLFQEQRAAEENIAKLTRSLTPPVPEQTSQKK